MPRDSSLAARPKRQSGSALHDTGAPAAPLAAELARVLHPSWGASPSWPCGWKTPAEVGAPRLVVMVTFGPIVAHGAREGS
jgi:hypothetical protein